MDMSEPNFLIIGAAKAGTTSLYHYLAQHPQVFLSANKEPHFFALENNPPDYKGPGDEQGVRSRITDWQSYLALFSKATGQHRAIGEASTLYLYHPDAPSNIHRHLPDMKMIALLRNPVDAAYSAFGHMYREGREPCNDFMQALKEEDHRVAENWAPSRHRAISRAIRKSPSRLPSSRRRCRVFFEPRLSF